MAQTTKKKSSPSSGKKTAAKKSAKQEEQVYSRIICAGVCLALGIFGFIAFFEKEAVLISLFRRLLTGLFGWGFFLCPFVLVYVFILLAFMRNRPAVPRLIFIFLSLLVVSELIHLIIAGNGYALGKGMVKLMWTGGQQLDCGGVLGGCIAEALRYLLSRIGSIIVLLALLIFFAVLGFDIPIRKLFTTKEKRTQDEEKRRKKEHMEQYAEEVQRRSKSVSVEPEPLKPAEPARKKRKLAVPGQIKRRPERGPLGIGKFCGKALH
ncbi:MAG: DNA translocase FtsK 4TM domain-containing protein, partial [Oscillospiraceae bacterium]|nr:DNA translocase FtsK 4TM domain-containing protein [Oscillospiraceae bacterium]